MNTAARNAIGIAVGFLLAIVAIRLAIEIADRDQNTPAATSATPRGAR